MAKLSKALLTSALAFHAVFGAPAFAGEFENSSYLGLIGVTDALQVSANNGAGVTFGVIDTGAAADHVEFGGRVNTKLSTCVIPRCSSSLATTDDNGHGTFVTSELIARKGNGGIVGVAPSAQAIEIKAISAQGSGSVVDVANGVRQAVDRGAQVLNLSLSFTPTPVLIAAINYAASKNAVIVYAGGNESQALLGNLKIAGFTDAAAQRLLFAGSTNAGKQLSAFSNTPGKGGLLSTTGKFYAFQDHWLEADGEAIWGASNYKDAQYGRAWYAQGSGTSMATPQLAGAAGLLAARWPFLLKNGTIPTILLQSGEDLGAQGDDSSYGSGFLRVDRAFQPSGPLQVALANGQKIPVASTAMVSGGATGKMNAVTKVLTKGVAFDRFNRDFPVNLGSAISTQAKNASSNATVAAARANAAVVRRFANLSDGGEMSLSFAGSASMPRIGADTGNSPALIQDPDSFDPTSADKNQWSFAFSRGRTYLGFGHGTGAAFSFSEARWEGTSAFWGTDAEASTALLQLGTKASYAVTGFDLGRSRFSMSWMASQEDGLSGLGGEGTARGMAFGYTIRPVRSKTWQVSFTSSFLDEGGMLLGSRGAGAFAIGDHARSTAFGIGTNTGLGHGWQFGLDALWATTDATDSRDSLIAHTSRLQSMSFGAALSKLDVLAGGDLFGLTLKKPLRVYSGRAAVTVATGVDGEGNPVLLRRSASLRPDGSETDLGLSYGLPVGKQSSALFSVTRRFDADNVAGARDVGGMIRFRTAI